MERLEFPGPLRIRNWVPSRLPFSRSLALMTSNRTSVFFFSIFRSDRSSADEIAGVKRNTINRRSIFDFIIFLSPSTPLRSRPNSILHYQKETWPLREKLTLKNNEGFLTLLFNTEILPGNKWGKVSIFSQKIMYLYISRSSAVHE